MVQADLAPCEYHQVNWQPGSSRRFRDRRNRAGVYQHRHRYEKQIDLCS